MNKLLNIAVKCVAAVVAVALAVALAVAFFICVLLIPINHVQYSTSDINDYGCYVGNRDNRRFSSKYIGAFFPENIEDTFTDVTYSYRTQNYAEYAFEAYLEFVIEDEKIFQEFISAKTYGLEYKVFSYDPSFIEYTLDDTLEIFVPDGEDNQNSKVEIRYAEIGKILCNPKEHRVIFVAMAMWDAWYAYSDYFCCYFDRFNIDPTKYDGVIIR